MLIKEPAVGPTRANSSSQPQMTFDTDSF